eukprot:g436.t1
MLVAPWSRHLSSFISNDRDAEDMTFLHIIASNATFGTMMGSGSKSSIATNAAFAASEVATIIFTVMLVEAVTPPRSKIRTRLQSLRCPICSVSLYGCDDLWHEIDRQIEETPMPFEYRQQIKISCNDCQQPSSVEFHILGQKCLACRSYNTRRETMKETSTYLKNRASVLFGRPSFHRTANAQEAGCFDSCFAAFLGYPNLSNSSTASYYPEKKALGPLPLPRQWAEIPSEKRGNIQIEVVSHAKETPKGWINQELLGDKSEQVTRPWLCFLPGAPKTEMVAVVSSSSVFSMVTGGWAMRPLRLLRAECLGI